MSTAVPDLKNANPRGIPKAPFVDLHDKQITNNVQLAITNLQQTLQKYEYMLQSKDQQLKSITSVVKDISTNLKVIKLLLLEKDDEDIEDEEEDDEIQYELEDGLYTFATIPKQNDKNTVSLWLGAGILMEFTYEEALQVLQEKHDTYNVKISEIMEDLEWLREQKTTMEVNIAKVYNYNVIESKKQQQQQQRV
ncbi:hypothetical protein QEN19_004015 [Hanseniaspora menglaensis]